MLNKRILRIAFPGICLLLAVLLWACTPGHVHFQRSWDVAQIFESYKVVPGLTYYYTGLPYSPDAIVGISKQYEMDSPHWHSVELDEKEMRHIIEEILNTAGIVPDRLAAQGAKILNDRGEQIGIWYSAWELPMITFITDKKFNMSRPLFHFPAPNQNGFD